MSFRTDNKSKYSFWYDYENLKKGETVLLFDQKPPKTPSTQQSIFTKKQIPVIETQSQNTIEVSQHIQQNSENSMKFQQKQIKQPLEAVFYKKQKFLGTNIARLYRIENKILYYRDNSKSTNWKGYLELSTCYVVFKNENKNTTQNQQKPKNQSYIIELRQNTQICELTTNNYDQFIHWQKALKKICFQFNFQLNYKQLKVIGQGSFAKVFISESFANKKFYAVKAFSKDGLLRNERSKKAVLNEISILQKIKHPHVLKIKEFYEGQNSVYIVMELSEGYDLSQAIKKRQYSVQETKTVIKDLLHTLQYIHSKGIIHRDLKPSNILLRKKNSYTDIVVADFGLATDINEIGVLYGKCGTPGYCAPEILKYGQGNQSYDYKADMFSVGVIFMLMLTGKHPFRGENQKQTLRFNKIGIVNPEHYKMVKNPLALDVIKKLLVLNPKSRYSAKDCLRHKFFEESHEPLSENSLYVSTTNHTIQASISPSEYQTYYHSQNGLQKKHHLNFISIDKFSQDSKFLTDNSPLNNNNNNNKNTSEHLVWQQPAWNGLDCSRMSNNQTNLSKYNINKSKFDNTQEITENSQTSMGKHNNINNNNMGSSSKVGLKIFTQKSQNELQQQQISLSPKKQKSISQLPIVLENTDPNTRPRNNSQQNVSTPNKKSHFSNIKSQKILPLELQQNIIINTSPNNTPNKQSYYKTNSKEIIRNKEFTFSNAQQQQNSQQSLNNIQPNNSGILKDRRKKSTFIKLNSLSNDEKKIQQQLQPVQQQSQFSNDFSNFNININNNNRQQQQFNDNSFDNYMNNMEERTNRYINSKQITQSKINNSNKNPLTNLNNSQIQTCFI